MYVHLIIKKQCAHHLREVESAGKPAGAPSSSGLAGDKVVEAHRLLAQSGFDYLVVVFKNPTTDLRCGDGHVEFHRE